MIDPSYVVMNQRFFLLIPRNLIQIHSLLLNKYSLHYFVQLNTRLLTALVRSRALIIPNFPAYLFIIIIPIFSYLDSSTGPKVEQTLVKVLIEAHIARIHDEFKPMVEHEKIDDLKRVFALVNRADKFRSESEKSNNVSPFLGK